MKDKLKILDKTFVHSKLGYCSDYQISDLFEWDRTINDIDDIVFTDMALNLAKHRVGRNYAWLIEPIDIAQHNYYLIKEIKGNFTKIFTHEKSLIDINDIYEFVPFGCCWIKKEDQQIYNKTKILSIIASNKVQTIGHQLRHLVIKAYGDKMDIFGRGWNPIEHKITGLRDYRFSIVIENCKRDYWFTEKLIDCLMTGTVPIYWGCPSISDFFDCRGFLIFNSSDDLNEIIDNLSEEKYNLMLPYIIENFNRAKNFILPDDWIYKKIKNKKDNE